ncbi:unnamed protein product [Calypogeia fissa]
MMKQEGRKGSVMYKSQLQEYAQKAAIPPPVYEFVKEGASHEPRFKAIVILNNVTYESPPGFPNLKSAEHAAAKAALDGLLQSNNRSGVTPSPVHESGLCKNLLQEYAQKNSLPLPVYQSQRSGEDHAPTFTSSVEIAGVKYSGGSAKNKKEAEIKAARTALLAIQSAQSSAPVAAPEPPVTAAPQAQVGLATYISTNLNNTSGKKRGRGAPNATADEPAAGRLKTDPEASQVQPEVPAKAVPVTPVKPIAPLVAPAVTPAVTADRTEPIVNLVTPSVPEVPKQPITTPVKSSSVDIADLFATPGAKKILQNSAPKTQQTENSYLSQGTTLLSPGQIMSSSLLSQNTTANSNMDIEGKSGTAQSILAEDVQRELVNGSSEMKEDQAFLQAAQSSGLISLTG